MDGILHWYAVLGDVERTALFSFFGTLLTAIGGLWVLNCQLGHDRKQRKLERDMNLAKEEFLNSIYIFNKTITLIIRSSDIKINYNDLAIEHAENTAQMYKILLIASNKTAKLIDSFMLEFLSTWQEVALQRINQSMLTENSSEDGVARLKLLKLVTGCAAKLSSILPNIVVSMRETLHTDGKASSFDKELFLKDMGIFNEKIKQQFTGFLQTIEGKLRSSGLIK